MRDEYSVCLLMTGPYENIYELQDEKTLNFLCRTPKIELKSLNITGVADKYKSVFKLSDEEGLKRVSFFQTAMDILVFLYLNLKEFVLTL